MKHIVLLVLIGLVGCSNGYKEAFYPSKPKELDDCKFFNIYNEGGSNITVVRCPNSTTTTKTGGKGPKTTIVIDGETYVKEEK